MCLVIYEWVVNESCNVWMRHECVWRVVCCSHCNTHVHIHTCINTLTCWNKLPCNTLQRTAAHCNTLQHATTRCDTHIHIDTCINAATYCNALQHTATHCNTLKHAATRCNTLQHTATHCNTPQHTATHWNTLQHTATHCNTLQHTATHCNMLQHTCIKSGSKPASSSRNCTLQCVAVCSSVLQRAKHCRTHISREMGVEGDSVLQHVAVCWSVLQCVAVCCSVLQCVAVCVQTHSNMSMRVYKETTPRGFYFWLACTPCWWQSASSTAKCPLRQTSLGSALFMRWNYTHGAGTLPGSAHQLSRRPQTRTPYSILPRWRHLQHDCSGMHVNEWSVLSHLWMSHRNVSCHTLEWIISHVGMSPQPESFNKHKCPWVVSDMHMSVNEACHTLEWFRVALTHSYFTNYGMLWIVPQICISHITLSKESCHVWIMNCVSFQCIMTDSRVSHDIHWNELSHVTNWNESCSTSEWGWSRVYMIHITHMWETNTSGLEPEYYVTYEWVMAHT